MKAISNNHPDIAFLHSLWAKSQSVRFRVVHLPTSVRNRLHPDIVRQLQQSFQDLTLD